VRAPIWQAVSSRLYRYVPHPHIEHRKKSGPATVAGQLPRGNAVQRFNARAALLVTRGVGTMWCAYAFALFDLISLPEAVHAGTAAIVSWVAQTFLQLVLLSVIMVGQSVQAAAADKRGEDTYKDAEAVLAEAVKIQEHLQAQDEVLTALIAAHGGPGHGG